MSTIIELGDVKKHYMLGTTKVEALRGVSFQITRGEFTAIAGPSGSGKSTILNMVGCIDNPSSGTIIIGGDDVSGLSDKRLTKYRRSTISFIFQSFNLIPVLNVYENIELPLLLEKGMNEADRKAHVMQLIEEVGLTDRIKNKPNQLSGGQRQRVAIARALVTKPLVVLADEPTANLDSVTGAKILELMEDLNKRQGTTFVFSTHDHTIMDKARRVISIQDGLITSDVSKAGLAV
ncbi:MAG: ABC transporter ATP-binding protein [Spirochaetales bacterium]